MKNYKKIILNLSLLLVASYSFGADVNFNLDVPTLDLDISTFDLDIPTLDLDSPIDLVSEPMPELVTEQVPEQATNFVDNFANGESALDPLTYPESDLPDPDQLDPAAKYSLFTMFEEEAVNDGLSLLDDAASSENAFDQSRLEEDFTPLTKKALPADKSAHKGKRQHACNFKGCKYVTASSADLVKHMRTHTGEKPYKCNECSYSAARLHDLEKHERIHTGEKPYKCNECGYSAAQPGALKAHMSIHTGEKPFRCKECSYSTAQSAHLNTHVRTHTGEKPFQCEKCSYSATRLGNLNRHIRTHTGEKPYKCGVPGCGYAASHLNSLGFHRKKYHKKETESKIAAICSESGLPGSAQLNVAAALGSYVEAAHDVLSLASTFEQGQLGADFEQLTQKALPVPEEMHTGKKLLQCDVVGCSYTTVQPKRFANHKTTHEQAQNSLAGKRSADNGDENPAKRVCQEPLM